MIKKTITYVDFNDLERKEDFYFHMSKTELTEKDISKNGGFADYLQKLADAKDIDVIADTIKTMILQSYGIKSDDGRRFMKSEDISLSFYQSPAYDVLFEELISDPNKAAEFFKNVLPKELSEKVDAELKKNPNLLKTGN